MLGSQREARHVGPGRHSKKLGFAGAVGGTTEILSEQV